MKTAAFKYIGKEKCTGCSLCMNVCPYDAIKMELDENGFIFPNIDNNKCTNCGICYDKCPIINNKNKNWKNPISYAAYSKDDITLKNSSSGGVFSEISKKIIDENGKVYGVAWNYKELFVYHKSADKTNELKELRGSKYLQSFVGMTYKKINKDLENNKKVLFVGTPCQVAAMNNYIQSDNLYTIDLICHGIPSLTIFRSYLKENFKENITKIDFRNKKKGWNNYFVQVQNNYYPHSRNNFFKGYLDNLYLNEICYNCPFSSIPRQGDITLGDYWGVPKEIDNNNKGISAVVINNEKGSTLIKGILNIKIIEQDLEKIKKGNPRLYSGYNRNTEKKGNVFKDYKIHGFNYIAKKYVKMPSYTKYISKIIFSKVKKTIKKIIRRN
jgi:coenzyme F420-reducing hydrogenase beta subunit